MLVCHCLAVNDRRILDEVANGALTVDDVAERCGAGAACGGCRRVVGQLVSVGAPDARGERFHHAA